MDALRNYAERFPDAAKDIRLNLANLLQGSTLQPAQAWGVAAAVAFALREPGLRDAVLTAAAAAGTDDKVIDDAMAAAALMAMNNVYYRFRHFADKPVYQQKPPRLRMQRMMAPATNKADFELFSLAVSAINGCEMCVKAHEAAVLAAGLNEDQVHDAIRIAAVLAGAATANTLHRPTLSA